MSSGLVLSIDRRILVVSDVHIGVGELDDFTSELEAHLVAFIKSAGGDQDPVELVINGDFFDFATAEPWDEPHMEAKSRDGVALCFTEVQSCRKLENIINAHELVFDALVTFLRASELNRITILPGNHDVDLFWPSVRQQLTERVAQRPGVGSDQLVFVLERQYVIIKGQTRYWIEHGHQYDPPNSFFVSGCECWSVASPPILIDSSGCERLYECPGTLGLVRYINRWRRRYQSISYIKPYSRILMALASYKAFKEPGRPILLCWHLAHLLGWDLDLKMALTADDDIRKACHAVLQETVRNLGKEEVQEFKTYLKVHNLTLANSLENFVETEFRCDRVINCVASSEGAQKACNPILVDNTSLGLVYSMRDIESHAHVCMAKRLIENKQADYVLTGHTHAPLVSLNGHFLNGGCWIPNQSVGQNGDVRRIIFEHGSIPYELTYLEIGKNGGAPTRKTYKTGAITI